MKKNIHKLFLLFGLLIVAVNLNAQSQSDMRINELLVINTDDFEDDFGHKNGWIELFNSSYGTIDIGGCYLTNDPTNLTKYIIPKGDVLTKIKPRQHTLFWADNEPFRGTFHTNFKLIDSQEIILVSSDGKTIIDRIKIPHELLDTNKSYGRIYDGVGSTDGTEGWQMMKKTSPSTNNEGVEKIPASVIVKKMDPYGIVMALTAMGVVFIALILLYLIFKNTGKYHLRKSNKKAAIATGNIKHIENDGEFSSAETFAAIAMAIHQYHKESEAHDFEHTVLTINKVQRAYSPWSSKIYMLRDTPRKK